MKKLHLPKNVVGAALLAASLSVALVGCGLDATILSQATKDDHVVPPPAQDSRLIVQVDEDAFVCGGSTELLIRRADGTEQMAIVSTGTDETTGAEYYDVRLSGAEAYAGLILQAAHGGQDFLGIVPAIPRQDSVYAPEKVYKFGEASGANVFSLNAPAMLPLSADTTAITVALARRLEPTPFRSLAAIPRDVMIQAIVDVEALLEGTEFRTLVHEILACGVCSEAPFVFPADLEEAEVEGVIAPMLNPAFVEAARGQCTALENLSVAAFEASLNDAIGTYQMPLDFDPNNMRVVFMAQLAPGPTGNCSDTNPTKWLDDGALTEASRTMFITGGVHAECPVCDENRTEYCVSQEEWSRINIEMGDKADGGWTPNVVKMYDDGTHGDAVGGDGIYTWTIDVPYWDPEEAPDGAGMRLSYKYTWGNARQPWTGTEEWPGNARLLEVVDINGDQLVMRYDFFGDETTNKDKQNGLMPARGGCGVVLWEAQKEAGGDQYASCVMESREAMYDSDGDCEKDMWPSNPSVLPIVLESDGEGE